MSTSSKFSPKDLPSSHGFLNISLAADDLLGVGVFKTAHRGSLYLPHMPRALPFAPSNGAPVSVAVKRLYYSPGKQPLAPSSVEDELRGKDPSKKVLRYTIAEELEQMEIEANVLHWATSLHNFVYNFVERELPALSEDAQKNARDQIPELRFAFAGLAHAHGPIKQDPASLRSTTATTIRAIYLVEELVTDSGGELEHFEKYIANASGKICLTPEDSDPEE